MNGTLPSDGATPCYLALSPDGKWLAVANYGDGTLAILRVDPDTGALREVVDRFRPGGDPGPNPHRQDGPHAHCAIFGRDVSDVLYHVDLGLDCVFRHDLQDSGISQTRIAYRAPPGSGPRHLAWYPDKVHAVLICELAASLLLLRHDGPNLVCIDSIATAPMAEPADNLGGHLAIDADGTIRVTNRGHDSLADFVVADGRLQRRGWRRTGGSSPRHFQIIGDRAIVGHEEGGGLTCVVLGQEGGDPAHLALPAPVFILHTNG